MLRDTSATSGKRTGECMDSEPVILFVSLFASLGKVCHLDNAGPEHGVVEKRTPMRACREVEEQEVFACHLQLGNMSCCATKAEHNIGGKSFNAQSDHVFIHHTGFI